MEKKNLSKSGHEKLKLEVYLRADNKKAGKQVYIFHNLLTTHKVASIMRVTNQEINFFPKGQST